MKRTISSTLYFLVFWCSLQAQTFFEKGIIITKKGDTISGFIRNDVYGKLTFDVYFKKTEIGGIRHFTPDSLRAFMIAPDQYFESHTFFQKESPTARYTNKKYFLRRIQSGYLSVFELDFYGKYTYFLKKHGETTIHPLYMTVKPRNVDNPKIDTLTDNRNNAYPEAAYSYGTEFLKTYSLLIKDWKDYKPHKFTFDEATIKREVAAYNRAMHPQFQSPMLMLQSPQKWLFTLGFNATTPTNLAGRYRPDDVNNYTVISKQHIGFEVVAGVLGRGIFKNFGLEIGFSQTRPLKTTYNYRLSGPSGIGWDGEQEIKYQNFLTRVNYTFMLTRKVSPYISVGYSRGNVKVKQKQVGWQPPYFVDEKSLNNTGNELFFAGGLQWSPTTKHNFRAEVDMSPPFFERPYASFFKLGYQFRFRL
jgi:hypothetical protein